MVIIVLVNLFGPETNAIIYSSIMPKRQGAKKWNIINKIKGKIGLDVLP
jgi:hypothetical protein